MLQGLGRTQQDLLNALLHQAGGMSIDELAEHLAVTRTAIRQHLAALERDGLVLRGETRPTGRRPEQLYQLTDHAREQFPRQYQLLASALIDEVADIIGPEALATLMRNLGRKLALDREQQVVDETKIVQHMNQAGYEAEVFFRSSGDQEIVAHNCVFHRLAAAHPVVCELDLALIGALGGAEVEHTECMVRGGNVCRFKLRPTEPPTHH
ncbi:HTH domain-containing protein [Pseudomonas umsongensis]|jgi:predicted ArsR family transcriptional regulator|uniref:HTH domain-containing protein n=1 Tax=Pseudomonas umsongensis TaxID=198618 RepID=A0AAE7DF70_9PSED|nr:HTH domain-containing protein [Pseudomonas umsongensis]KEX93449.1 transcriptional regulator [Pseudomonas putida]MBT9569997.1 HTH domain-containing protein [Pseudomonas umsongensis]OXR35672.1 MarR family transcriptional regulator [Pseudomonas umsongensis]QFG30889.1 HTH domain-containing protein [Pseudomonas umsongensis]QJC80113.1 HTH domain-containing protein [Pseudomonas umsongensis]